MIAIATAWLGGGSWALVLQITAFGILSSTLLWYRAPFVPAFSVGKANMRSILSFSNVIAGSKLVEFVASRAIEFIILGRLGAAALGAYFLGAKLAQTALQIVSPPFIDVAHSVFSRASRGTDRVTELYFRGIVVCGLTVVPIMAQLSALSGDVARLIYGELGAPAATVLGCLSLLGALTCLQYVSASFANATGRPEYNLYFTMVRATTTTSLLLMWPVRNVTEIVVVFALAEAILFPVSIWLSARLAGITIQQWCGRLWPIFAAVFVMHRVMAWLSGAILLEQPLIARIVCIGAIGAALFLAVVWVLDGKRMRAALFGLNEK